MLGMLKTPMDSPPVEKKQGRNPSFEFMVLTETPYMPSKLSAVQGSVVNPPPWVEARLVVFAVLFGGIGMVVT
jgi:hypothetical protein